MSGQKRIQLRKHRYLSTACMHEMHDKCRLTCKYCGDACHCGCHTEEQQ